MKNLLLVLILALSACVPVEQPDPPTPALVVNGYSFPINGDTIAIGEWQWQQAKLGAYPFTTQGDLACTGDSVEFYPDQLSENDIGLPLNQIAKNQFKQANLTPTVSLAIKENSDLTNVIFIGLSLCNFNRNNNF